jgi:hypothetical protein
MHGYEAGKSMSSRRANKRAPGKGAITLLPDFARLGRALPEHER